MGLELEKGVESYIFKRKKKANSHSPSSCVLCIAPSLLMLKENL
jgi:hypothetical protein